MNVAFYQLLKTPLDKALPKLLEKVYSSGFRVLVVCESPEKMEILNTVLWTFSTGAFLPHGYQGDPMRHPLWLSLMPDNVNEANVVVVTNGIVIPADPPHSFEKCLDIFDGNDETATMNARQRYAEYKSRGCHLTFWKQTSEGNWENGA